LNLQRESHAETHPSHISFYWNQISRFSHDKQDCQRIKRNPGLLKPLVGQTMLFSDKLLDPRSLAVTAHAIAKISFKTRKSIVDSSRLWEVLEANIMEKATTTPNYFDSQECANILWSFAKIGRKADPLFNAMVDQISPKLEMCNAQDIANTVWAYATADHPAPALFDAIIQSAIEKLDKFDSQNLANTVWAYATLAHSAPELFDAVSQTAITKLDAFNSQAIANTVWAYASAGHSDPVLFDAISQSAIKKFDMFNSQEIAITLWGYATLNHHSPELFDAVSQLAIEKLHTFNSQGIANTVWAYATIGHSAPKLFYAISQLVIKRINMFNTQTIANRMRTYPMPGYNLPPELMNAAVSWQSTSISGKKLDTFNSQAIANTMWAYATVGHSDPQLFDAMSQLAIQKLNTFNSQELANTMWAYATANHRAPALFYAISQFAIQKLDKFKPQEIANTLWAFATVSHPAPELFDAVSQLAIEKMHTFNSQEIANTVWAYATVYHYVNPQLMNAIMWEAIQKLDSLESEQIVNILWSVVVLNSIEVDSAVPFFSEISKRYYQKGDEFFKLSREAMSQLHQASLWYSDEHKKESLLPQKLREECLSNFSSNENIPSKLQHDVVETFQSLNYLGLTVMEEESRCTRTGYSIDVLIGVGNSSSIAVEIDGPCHFVGYSPNGATMLKRRQLCGLGDTPFLSVPYWEWDMLNCSTEQQRWHNRGTDDYYSEMKRRQAYLQQRLQQASFL